MSYPTGVSKDEVPPPRTSPMARAFWNELTNCLVDPDSPHYPDCCFHADVKDAGTATNLRANLRQRAIATRRPHHRQGPFPVNLSFQRRKRRDGSGVCDIYVRLIPLDPQDVIDQIARNAAFVDSLNAGADDEDAEALAARLDAEEDAALAELDAGLAALIAHQSRNDDTDPT